MKKLDLGNIDENETKSQLIKSKVKKDFSLDKTETLSDNEIEVKPKSNPPQTESVPEVAKELIAPKPEKVKRQLSEKQKENLIRGRQLRDAKRQERMKEKQVYEEKQKEKLEEKIVKRAIQIKKRQLKKEKIIEPSDDEEEDEQPAPIKRVPTKARAKLPPAPVQNVPPAVRNRIIFI